MSNATATKTSTKRPTAPGKAAAKTAKAKSPAPTITKASASQAPVVGVNKYGVKETGPALRKSFIVTDLMTGEAVSKAFPTRVLAQEDADTRNAWGKGKRPTVKAAKSAEADNDHADKKTARLATRSAKSADGGKRTRHAEGPQRGDPKLAAGDKSLRGATVRVTDGPMKGKTGTLAGFTLSQKKYPIWKVKPTSGEPFNQIAHRLEVTAPPAPTATA